MITVFADQHLFKIKEIVPEEIDLRFYDPEDGLPANLDDADALLIRTVTNINKDTLPDIPGKLKFVGTGSAGTDHVDTGFLAKHGIQFAHSAGCNARSVAEYVVTSLMIWSNCKNIDLQQETIGIIGVGHVGTALQNMLQKLDWNYTLYDPPRAEREDSFQSASPRELMECSILTFHTPLHDNGKHSTHHWLDVEKLSGRNFKLVINTSRGGVVDEQALLDAMDAGRLGDIIIDVWENEPHFDDHVAQKAFISTPHIAGYSIQAKFRATSMIVESMLDFFSLELPIGTLNEPPESVTLNTHRTDRLQLHEVLKNIHPVKKYHQELTSLIGLSPQRKATRFRRLRTGIPFRNEFSNLQIPNAILDTYPLLYKII